MQGSNGGTYLPKEMTYTNESFFLQPHLVGNAKIGEGVPG